MKRHKAELKLKARLDIHKISGGDEDQPMRITIEDDLSGCRILEANFSLEGFMRALTSQGGIKGSATLYTGPFGFTPERKDEILPRPKKHQDEKECSILLSPFEIDGWKGSKSDLQNHHRWVEHDKVRVSFIRFVKDGEVYQ